MTGKSSLYFAGCEKFIKSFRRKYHRKPDIIETQKFILETYGSHVLLEDALRTISMLLIECMILDGLFFSDSEVVKTE